MDHANAADTPGPLAALSGPAPRTSLWFLRGAAGLRDLPGRAGDRLGVDARRVQQLVGLARRRHLTHGELDDRRPVVGLRQRVEHGVTEAALRPVVLDRHDRAAVAGGRADGLLVDRLDRVGVDDARADALALELLGRGERLIDGDAAGDDGDV